MKTWHLFLLGFGAIGCETRDPCLEAHRTFVSSASGAHRASVFTGPCPSAAPQILIEFQHGAGGAGVFAVSDSMLQMRARWISEDTLQIDYPSDAQVVKKELFAQYGSDRVAVLYDVGPASGQR